MHVLNPLVDDSAQADDIALRDFHTSIDHVRRSLNAALRGKQDVVERVLACLLARGHLLIEDLPGLGKTTLAKALATAVGGRFNRVQCTPDLLPADVTGFSIFNQKSREFEFLPGPVFTDVLLVDEINRTTPRTQSALLEAMAEGQVTVDNQRRALAESFFVIATQNPADHQGTYALPEAQLDRFAMKVRIGYPSRDHELRMLEAAVGHCCDLDTEQPGSTLRFEHVHVLQRRVVATHVSSAVRQYIVDLAGAVRAHKRVPLGLSPRGVLTWQRVAQAWAFLKKRDFVTPDDVQEIAGPVLEVRLGVDGDGFAAVLSDVLASVPVPVAGMGR